VTPRFSVVVPTRGRPQQLTACLRALAGLDYSRDRFEVIVVVDGDGLPPKDELRRLDRELALTLVSQPAAGPAAARNTGARRAGGALLAFTDDDCAPASDWLRRLEHYLEQPGSRVVGGRTVNGLADNAYSAASQLVIDALYDHYHGRASRGRFFTTNNVALAAEDFWALGGFDMSFPLPAAEDREFGGRCARSGYELTYAPDVVVVHRHDLTLRSFCRQHFTYGRGAVHLRSALHAQGLGRESVEVGFYPRLLRLALGRPKRGRLTPLVLASQLTYAAGAGREALSKLTAPGGRR
jgi:GT2 family glycosyltransferase